MSKKAFIITRAQNENLRDVIETVKEKLQSRNFEVYTLDISKESDKKKVSGETLEEAALLVTFELAGFEISTQSGSFLYNILPAKSIHFLSKELEEKKAWLQNRKMSIAMFFVGLDMDNGQCEEWKRALPLLPWLAPCGRTRKEVEKMLERILKEAFLL